MCRVGIGFVMTAMLSELLKERPRVFDRLDVWCHSRGGGKETLLMGASIDVYIQPRGDAASLPARSALGGTDWDAQRELCCA